MSSNDPNARADADAALRRSQRRSRRYETEHRSRLRRQSNKKRMEEQVRALEFVVQQMPSLHAAVGRVAAQTVPCDNDPSIAHPVTEDRLRLQNHVIRSVKLAGVTEELKREATQLRRLLREYAITTKTLRSWFQPPPISPWELDVERWNALTHTHFSPWTIDECSQAIKDALWRIHDLSSSTDFVSSGCEFMGWSDRRRLDAKTATFQFSFSKGFPKCDAQWLFDEYWSMHFSAQQLCQKMLGLSNKVHIELLQKVSDDIFIFRRDVKYAGCDVPFHAVYMMFRLRSPKGFLHCVQTITAPQIERILAHEGGWMNIFHWTTMEYLADPDTMAMRGCRVAFTGTLSSLAKQFAERWMMEMVMTLVRAESSFVSPLFLRSGKNGPQSSIHTD